MYLIFSFSFSIIEYLRSFIFGGFPWRQTLLKFWNAIAFTRTVTSITLSSKVSKYSKKYNLPTIPEDSIEGIINRDAISMLEIVS